MNKLPALIWGKRAAWIRRKLHFNIVKIMLREHRSPLKALKALKHLMAFRRKQQGLERIFKFVKSDGRYFWSSEVPGFPSPRLAHVLKSELARHPNNTGTNGRPPAMITLIWGITNRCPLSCSHCYDWENIEATDKLSLGQLFEVLRCFEGEGLKHLQFSGGEPLARFSDLTALLREASKRMDCWLLTSGFGLSAEKAHTLKQAGLLGANISLDHWDEEKHNAFRNNNQSFEWVKKAARNCKEAGLMVSLSLCATRAFVSKENLFAYASLAKEWGVHFIRILEPRAVGSFAGQEVHLNGESISVIAAFFHQINSDPAYKQFPIVNYFGYHQREIGCMGAGNRYLYVDANGEVHACPFCRGSKGNVLKASFTETVKAIRETGCHFFKNQE
ncbi:MAG: radical SAM protein [Bacteroidales bacterium]|nr:radical SAM protein [Bacteroidales bacterium]